LGFGLGSSEQSKEGEVSKGGTKLHRRGGSLRRELRKSSKIEEKKEKRKKV